MNHLYKLKYKNNQNKTRDILMDRNSFIEKLDASLLENTGIILDERQKEQMFLFHILSHIVVICQGGFDKFCNLIIKMSVLAVNTQL